MERTLSIIKPDAVGRGLIGVIIARLEMAGLKPVGIKMLRLSKEVAGGFYHVHRGKEFFEPLVEYMISGPVVVMALEGDGAINRYRSLMGATDPAKAIPGTIRRDYGETMRRNSVHGSDSPESASFEIAYFFSGMELL